MNNILLALLLIILSNPVNAITLEFSEADIQETVSAMMPLKQKKMFVTVIFTNPVVKLIKTSNKIGVKADIQALIPGVVKGTGMAEITGSLRYNSQEGAFYLTDPVISSMHVNRVKKSMQPEIKKLAQTAITKNMTKQPIYKLNDEDAKQKLAKSALKSVSVNDGKLIVEFGIF